MRADTAQVHQGIMCQRPKPSLRRTKTGHQLTIKLGHLSAGQSIRPSFAMPRSKRFMIGIPFMALASSSTLKGASNM